MPALVVPFTKMHGAGNDFLVLDNRFFHFSEEELVLLARRWCRRRFGVGADGLLALDPPEAEGQHYRMRYHNPDGSRAGMCGNGARCLARFARRAGLDAEPLVFGSDAGVYRAAVPEDDQAPVRLFVPPPRDFRPDVIVGAASVSTIYTGTHHAVLFTDDLDGLDLGALAPPIRRDPALGAEGVNVNAVEVTAAGTLRIRTFEKGVEAETLACGTGAIAAAAVAVLTGRVADAPVTLEARGGTLTVGLRRAGEALADAYLEGPAERVFEGTLEF